MSQNLPVSRTHSDFHGPKMMKLDDGWGAPQIQMDGMAPMVEVMQT